MATRNRRSLFLVCFALAFGIIVVATTITILSRRIEISKANTNSLMAVLSEGLFFFDRAGVIAPERSQALEKTIPGAGDVTNLCDFVSRFSTVSEGNVKTCLNLLWNEDGDDFLSDFDSTITFLPRKLILDGGRTVNVDYRPIYGKAKALEKVVVVATDVTDALKNQREAVAQAERVRKISRVAAGLESYQSFFDEAATLFARTDAIFAQRSMAGPRLIQLRRDLHTLKGSLGTFEFASIAQQIHDLETLIEEEGAATEKALSKWQIIKDQWNLETDDIDVVLGLKENVGKVTISKSKFDSLTKHAASTGDTRLSNLLEESLRVPVKEAFAKYEAYLEKLTERRSDKKVRIDYVPDSSDLAHVEMQTLDAAFVHIFRNCLDHGIEDMETRNRSGKSEVGIIQIACYRKFEWLHFVIKDDGGGVNGDKLAQKAVQAGIWTHERALAATYQEKIELVFVPNLSTKDEVTEISGRGVGMDAVKGLLEEISGKITIYSEPGQGTRFEIIGPSGKKHHANQAAQKSAVELSTAA